MASIDTFKGAFLDIARPNRYRVVITGPIVPPREVNLMCNETSLPPKTITTFEHKVRGADEKFPYDELYEDFEMTFYLDSYHRERNFFLDWMDNIIDPVTKKFEFYHHYASTITIHQMDRANNDTFVAKLHEAYPKNVGEVRLAYEEEDTVETFTVIFVLKEWEREYRTLY